MEIHTIGILGMSRTAVINQIRGLLLERGITIRKDVIISKCLCLGSWKMPTTSCQAHCVYC